MVEVHEQERYIVKDVDGGEGIVEFDGVEKGRPAFDDANIAQMQVAVTVPDPA